MYVFPLRSTLRSRGICAIRADSSSRIARTVDSLTQQRRAISRLLHSAHSSSFSNSRTAWRLSALVRGRPCSGLVPTLLTFRSPAVGGLHRAIAARIVRLLLVLGLSIAGKPGNRRLERPAGWGHPPRTMPRVKLRHSLCTRTLRELDPDWHAGQGLFLRRSVAAPRSTSWVGRSKT